MLKQAKSLQAAARSGKDQIRKTCSQIIASLERNRALAKQKAATKLAKTHNREESKAADTAAKLQTKLGAQLSSTREKISEGRQKMLLKWEKCAKTVSQSGVDTKWFDVWLTVTVGSRAHRRRFLTPEAFEELLAAVPSSQQTAFEATAAETAASFAKELELDAKEVELEGQIQVQRAEGSFHAGEYKYHQRLALSSAEVPAGIPNVDPGILQTTAPGTVAPGQFGSGHYTDWNTRYQFITGQLAQAMQMPVPVDYHWGTTRFSPGLGD
jgi:hypothetical protein